MQLLSSILALLGEVIILEQLSDLYVHLKLPTETKMLLQARAKKEHSSVRYVVAKMVEDTLRQQQLKDASPIVVTKLTKLIDATNRNSELLTKLIKLEVDTNQKIDLLLN